MILEALMFPPLFLVPQVRPTSRIPQVLAPCTCSSAQRTQAAQQSWSPPGGEVAPLLLAECKHKTQFWTWEGCFTQQEGSRQGGTLAIEGRGHDVGGTLRMSPSQQKIDAPGICHGLGVNRTYIPDLTPLVSRSVRLPRRACSSSKALNRELKLPAPKPWWLWRWMTSRKSVGRSCMGLVKI